MQAAQDSSIRLKQYLINSKGVTSNFLIYLFNLMLISEQIRILEFVLSVQLIFSRICFLSPRAGFNQNTFSKTKWSFLEDMFVWGFKTRILIIC